MTNCAGSFAEERLEAYVAGTLPDAEAQAFEEHYFECTICLAQLQALQCVASGLRRSPLKAPARVMAWPTVPGAFGAIAALLLITVIGYRSIAHRPDVAAVPSVSTSPAQSASASALTEVADLTLPPFEASNLRGEAANSNYRAGMKAYAAGDCSAAVGRLVRVPAGDADALSAQLYAGVCQLKLKDVAEAARTLAMVADKGDSPQQEAAVYYLAQTDVLRADPVSARRNLEAVIALHGDFESRAQAELKRIPAEPVGR